MGRYASYGIIDTFRISLDSLDREIHRNIWGKSLKDFGLEEILSQLPLNIYDVEESEGSISFRLKDTITSKEIVGVMDDFFKIFPYKIKGIELILEKLSSMTMEELRSFARRREEENFQDFSLYGEWYSRPVKIDHHILYPNTDVKGFMIYSSCSKMVVEDDIEPFNFLTELLRYRLKENPLADTLISFLSQ